jgi:hypothetical protein
MIDGTGKIKLSKTSRTAMIFVPSVIVTDSTFPFANLPEHVNVRIDGKNLVIEPLEVKRQ